MSQWAEVQLLGDQRDPADRCCVISGCGGGSSDKAIALHQRNSQEETSWPMEPPISAPDDLEDRAEKLREEFGKEAQCDWWDPGRQGKVKLEKAAEEHQRFAGGEEPILARMDLVVIKWMSQYIHHTAIGLPCAPTREEAVEAHDTMFMVAFAASWLYAQQIYLMFELNHLPFEHINTTWCICMATFGAAGGMSEEGIEALIGSWFETYGQADDETLD